MTDVDTIGLGPTFSVSGGADQALFSIDGASGALTFDAAPDFELPTHTGETQKLSDALAEGPVVLMFYRGFW